MALDLNPAQLQLDTPVYATSLDSKGQICHELAGRLRLVQATAKDPHDISSYTIHSLVVCRGEMGNDVIVPFEKVAAYNEGKDGQRITLSISEDEIADLPEFAAVPTRNGRDYRDSGYKRSNRPRSNNRGRSFGGRRPNSDR